MKRHGNPRDYNRNRYFQRDQRYHQEYYYHEHQRQDRIERQRPDQHRFLRERERQFASFHQFNQPFNQFNQGMRHYRPPQQERRSVLLPAKKEEKQPIVQKESSSEDDFDQDFIEESIDKIDTEMDKQERLLANIRAKMSSIKEKEEVPRIVIGDQKAISPTLVGIRSSKMRHGVGYTTNIESIYDENKRLIKAVNKKHAEYSAVLTTATYDPRLWTRLEKVDIQKRPAIVAFIRAHVLASNREQQKLLLKYENIEDRYQENHDFVVEEEILFEDDSRKRKGRGDVIRSDLEFEKTIAMLSKSDPLLWNYGHPAHSSQRENLINESRFNPMGLANVPPMVSRPSIEKMTTFYNNNDLAIDAKHDLVEYNSRMSWGESERQSFRSYLVQYGKDFYKIGKAMKKPTDEVVQYYYVEKVHSRFKNLLKRGGRGRKIPIDESDFKTYFLQSDEEFVHPWQEQETDDESSDGTKQEDGWTAEEKQKAIRGFELFGRDFASVATLLPSKTPADCKQFFNNIRRSNDNDDDKDKKKRKKNPLDDEHEKKRLKAETAMVSTMSIKDKRSISYWSLKEREDFLEQLEKHGRNWDAIAQVVQSKSAVQVRNFFHNGRKKLGLDAILEKHQQNIRQTKFKDLLNPTSPSNSVQEILPEPSTQYVPAGMQTIPKIRLLVRSEPIENFATPGILSEDAENVVKEITTQQNRNGNTQANQTHENSERKYSAGITISDIINDPAPAHFSSQMAERDFVNDYNPSPTDQIWRNHSNTEDIAQPDSSYYKISEDVIMEVDSSPRSENIDLDQNPHEESSSQIELSNSAVIEENIATDLEEYEMPNDLSMGIEGNEMNVEVLNEISNSNLERTVEEDSLGNTYSANFHSMGLNNLADREGSIVCSIETSDIEKDFGEKDGDVKRNTESPSVVSNPLSKSPIIESIEQPDRSGVFKDTEYFKTGLDASPNSKLNSTGEEISDNKNLSIDSEANMQMRISKFEQVDPPFDAADKEDIIGEIVSENLGHQE